uniref:glycosyltransferase family 2 protein n=1 Tax=Desulfonatronospira sp. TaxID=1962951 RepID=UPI0025BA9F45
MGPTIRGRGRKSCNMQIAYDTKNKAVVQDLLEQSLVVIPAHNEACTVGHVVEAVHSIGLTSVVVDDHSQDDTRDAARKQGALVLRLPWRLGAWGAIQTGMRYCVRNGYKYCITLDADGQHIPCSIQNLLRYEYLKIYDVLIGSCPKRVSRMRRFAWSWFRSISETDLQDLTSGLRVYNRRAMRLMLDKRAYLFDYQDIGAILLLKKFG